MAGTTMPGATIRGLAIAALLAGSTRAQFEYAAALAARGDMPGAVEHLRIAERLGDPNAAVYLRKLGR